MQYNTVEKEEKAKWENRDWMSSNCKLVNDNNFPRGEQSKTKTIVSVLCWVALQAGHLNFVQLSVHCGEVYRQIAHKASSNN